MSSFSAPSAAGPRAGRRKMSWSPPRDNRPMTSWSALPAQIWMTGDERRASKAAMRQIARRSRRRFAIGSPRWAPILICGAAGLALAVAILLLGQNVGVKRLPPHPVSNALGLIMFTFLSATVGFITLGRGSSTRWSDAKRTRLISRGVVGVEPPAASPELQRIGAETARRRPLRHGSRLPRLRLFPRRRPVRRRSRPLRRRRTPVPAPPRMRLRLAPHPAGITRSSRTQHRSPAPPSTRPSP